MKALQLLLIYWMVKFLTSLVPKTNEALFSNLLKDISTGLFEAFNQRLSLVFCYLNNNDLQLIIY